VLTRETAGSCLRGYIKTVTMDDLRRLFNTMTGSDLDPVEQDVRISELTIEISQGRFIFYGEVWVDSYKVAAAEILVSVDGVMISGAIDYLGIGEELYVKRLDSSLSLATLIVPRRIPRAKQPRLGTRNLVRFLLQRTRTRKTHRHHRNSRRSRRKAHQSLP